MCGIFGIAKNISSKNDYEKIIKDINLFVNYSENRGSDTFGVSFKLKDNIIIYKSEEKPSRAIKRKEYTNFLDKNLKKNLDNQIILIGQTRLVTNGSKFSYENNQPIETKNLSGVHNGIFTNIENNINDKTINYESYNVKSDSLNFFEKLSKISEKNDFLEKYDEFIRNVRGNYSIAFFHKNEDKIYLSSNCGSLYYFNDKDFFCFASEKNFLKKFIINSNLNEDKKIGLDKIKKCLNKFVVFNKKQNELIEIDNDKIRFEKSKIFVQSDGKHNIFNNLMFKDKKLDELKRCSKCILPETYPLIKFDNNNVCQYCKNYNIQTFLGEKKLNQHLEKFRSKNGELDCIVGLSGGRDSSYGLHLLKEKYKMNPIAYTFDWGLTTDISRINAAKICGKLGIEHIIRSADIEKKRKYVHKNIFAWLKKPHLGMLPIVQAGDKGFIDYGRELSKELNIKLVVHFTGYQLEQREFFLAFAGINQKLKNNQRMSSYDFLNKLKMFYWYSLQFIKNPAYINSSLFDNFNGFLASFVKKENFLHFYNYEKWNEKEMNKVLIENYNWQDDISYGKNQWRMGDGQTAFNNFVYYTVAGFSEYDNFRSNQIREGLISREEALKLCKEDNKIRYDTLKNFSEVIGFNLDNVLSKVNCIDKLYLD